MTDSDYDVMSSDEMLAEMLKHVHEHKAELDWDDVAVDLAKLLMSSGDSGEFVLEGLLEGISETQISAVVLALRTDTSGHPAEEVSAMADALEASTRELEYPYFEDNAVMLNLNNDIAELVLRLLLPDIVDASRLQYQAEVIRDKAAALECDEVAEDEALIADYRRMSDALLEVAARLDGTRAKWGHGS